MSDQKLIIGYYRLSMEDDSEGESNSIINQRKLVKDYISHIPELAAIHRLYYMFAKERGIFFDAKPDARYHNGA